MKKRGILHPSILLAIFSLICGAQALNAQDVSDSSDQKESIKLTGSPVKAKDIAFNCDAVFVGEITKAGFPSDPAHGWVVYSGIAVRVSNVLRGSVESQIDVSLRTLSNSSTQESPPAYGHTYIFFVNKTTDASEDPYIVLKLLPATDDNVAMVKQLLAQKSQ